MKITDVLEDHLNQIKELQETYYPTIPKTADEIGRIVEITNQLRDFLFKFADKVDEAEGLINDFIEVEEIQEDSEDVDSDGSVG